MADDTFALDQYDVTATLLLIMLPALLAYLLVLGIVAWRGGQGSGAVRPALGLGLYAFMLGFAAPVVVMNTRFTIACWAFQAAFLCFRARHHGFSDFQSFLIAMVAFIVNLLIVPATCRLAGFMF